MMALYFPRVGYYLCAGDHSRLFCLSQGKGVAGGGIGAGSCSSSNSSSSSSGVSGGAGIVPSSSSAVITSTSTNAISTSSSSAVAVHSNTTSESTLLAAAAAAAAVAIGGNSVSPGGPGASNAITAATGGIAGLDYPTSPGSKLLHHHSAVSAASIGSIIGGMPGSSIGMGAGVGGGGGMDLSPPSKRLKSNSNISGGGGHNGNGGASGPYVGNGSLGLGLLGGGKKIPGFHNHPAFQHLAHAHHPGLAGALEMAEFVDPSGLLAGHNLSLGKKFLLEICISDMHMCLISSWKKLLSFVSHSHSGKITNLFALVLI